MELLSNGWNILLIILGFGLLIFVHELGHFLAARWAGIRCESFAIGMGPQVLSYRSGIGLRAGSTDAATSARLEKPAIRMTKAELAAAGVGETEYSLRALPLGGFVRMLGQDDMDPTRVSTEPGSYQSTPVWKRMIVVSAGVASNLVLAVLLFVVAFMIGVRFEAPVVGEVAPGSPAATAIDAAGGPAGLRRGDRIRSIDESAIETFADLQIAGAMARAEQPMRITVERGGGERPQTLVFTAVPTKSKASGLLSLGVDPAESNTLVEPARDSAAALAQLYQRAGLAQAGVVPGSTLVSIDGRAVPAWGALQDAANAAQGATLQTRWRLPSGAEVDASLRCQPEYQLLVGAEATDGKAEACTGLLGLCPLVQVASISDGSANAGILRAGDLVLRVGDLVGPRSAAFRRAVGAAKGGTLAIEVLRGGERVMVNATVGADGMLGISLEMGWESTMLASTMDELAPAAGETGADRPSPAAALAFLPLTRVSAIAGTPVSDWPAMREALISATRAAAAGGEGATVQVEAIAPTPGAERIHGTLKLAPQDVRALQALGWQSVVGNELFAPYFTTLSADGSPLRATAMGFKQTKTMVVMTYLTLDRIFRGSVAVKELRGPVGIVHLGTHVADRGFTYLIFFLAMISVNLAVLNFLPLPIVDGGLFLYLVYERLRGRPPSVAFINGATVVGLCLLGSLFLFTFYNDVMRLFTAG